MILGNSTVCKRNTDRAGGWTWLAREAAKCGQVVDIAVFFWTTEHLRLCVHVCVGLYDWNIINLHWFMHFRRLE